MQQAAVRPIPPYKFGTAIDLETLLGALFVAAVLVALFVAWYYRDLWVWKFRDRFTDIVGQIIGDDNPEDLLTRNLGDQL